MKVYIVTSHDCDEDGRILKVFAREAAAEEYIAEMARLDEERGDDLEDGNSGDPLYVVAWDVE